MAHDGSYEVTWKGDPFPFLNHLKAAPHPENYGAARLLAQQAAQGPINCPRSLVHDNLTQRVVMRDWASN